MAEDVSEDIAGPDLVARVARCLGRLRAWNRCGERRQALVVVLLFSGEERIEVGGEEGPGGEALVVAGVTARAEVDKV